MNSFQTIVLGIFGFFIIAGLIVVSMAKMQGDVPATRVIIWGTVPGAPVRSLIEEAFDPETLEVFYNEIALEKFDETFIEALASGRGPDMILIPAEFILRHSDKLVLLPYSTYTERSFKDTFIQEGDLFLFSTGIAALPFAIDPLVMFWNRDFLDEASISTPPKFWDEFLLLANRLSKKDNNGAITRSAVGLGEYKNISSAKEILSALMMQASANAGNSLGSILSDTGSVSAVSFYTEFANPQKPVFSWNRSLPSSRQMFLASRLAVYFGFGSEYDSLRSANPNLNFDIAVLPRPRNIQIGTTYGRLSGLAVLRTSRNASVAFQVAQMLTGQSALLRFAGLSGLPPVRRDLLSMAQIDSVKSVLYDSAIRSRGFLENNPNTSPAILQDMIESITSGRSRADEAVSRAGSQLR